MQRIFLLRAYGDFVIALQAISRSKQKIQIVASDHLAPLYHALIAAKSLNHVSIEFIALGIQQGQLNFFTNKHLLSWNTLKQLSRLPYRLPPYFNFIQLFEPIFVFVFLWTTGGLRECSRKMKGRKISTFDATLMHL